jgi:hypothetical protein
MLAVRSHTVRFTNRWSDYCNAVCNFGACPMVHGGEAKPSFTNPICETAQKRRTRDNVAGACTLNFVQLQCLQGGKLSLGFTITNLEL